MNANVPMLDEVAGNNTKEVIQALNKTIRQQQAEINRLNYDLDGFKQNFFVSGFHLQIKMANEQLVKQQEQIDEVSNDSSKKQNYALRLFSEI